MAVVVADVAVGTMGLAGCCCARTEPVAALPAEARSGSIEPEESMEEGGGWREVGGMT
jgi:hypothetical protein